MIGVTASALMLFGISLLFGMAHTTYVPQIIKLLPSLITQPAAVIGLVLALSGFFFKLALFPFHIWAPDVYQGSANQVTAYIATASKMAAAAMIIRFTGLSAGASPAMIKLLIVLSIFSMTFGNLVALIQKDIKRLLAYSSIAHAGYILIGILSLSGRGYASAIYYAAAYLVMNYSVFMVIMKLADDGHNLQIKELAGLHKRSPLLAMTLMLGLFGLAGIPPTAGFTGKFLVFAAALEKGYLFLVIIGMINATISLYYYLIVIKAAYLLKPVNEYPALQVDSWTRYLSIALVIMMIYLGIFPDQFLSLTEAAARTLLRIGPGAPRGGEISRISRRGGGAQRCMPSDLIATPFCILRGKALTWHKRGRFTPALVVFLLFFFFHGFFRLRGEVVFCRFCRQS